MGEWVRLSDGGAELALGDPARGLYVNGNSRPALGTEIARCIACAKRSINVVNPLMTDQRIIGELIAARSRGVRVRVITELRKNRGDGISYPTRGFEAGGKTILNEQFEAIRTLSAEGILCRGLLYYAHAKLLLADGAAVIVGSCNWNDNSLGWGPQPSLEAGMKIDEPAIVGGFADAFDSLWKACPLRFRQLGSVASLQQERGDTIPGVVLDRDLTDTCSMAWSYPPAGRGLRNRLIRLVASAKERLIVVAYSFYGSTQVPRLDSALREALARRVDVTVVVRPDAIPENKYPDPDTRALLECGVRLLGLSGLHAKGALADDAACAMFSANINPYSLECELESAHVECGLFETGRLSLLHAYSDFLKQASQQATHKWRS